MSPHKRRPARGLDAVAQFVGYVAIWTACVLAAIVLARRAVDAVYVRAWPGPVPGTAPRSVQAPSDPADLACAGPVLACEGPASGPG